MSDNLYHAGLNFYQNANADASEIKENFVIRQIEYRIIVDDMKRNGKDRSVQHYLLLGRRGSGKSTLLKRLQAEIDTDKKLSELYIAINPAEEQANIYRLSDLLEEIIKDLENREIEVGEYEFHEDTSAYVRQLFSLIHWAMEREGRKLVLLLDNIDRIFENLGDEAHLLREDLLNYGDIKIIGGSTRLTEHFWSYHEPFYEFFRVLELSPLTSEEIKTLLLNWSKKMNLPQIEEFVVNKPGQLETIRILTDGLPRTLQFFVNILLTRAQETGYEYLRLIMDSVTPLYQERLNTLPPAQRKIVLQMAFVWEAAGAGDLAVVTKMENNVVSAQLKQLAGKGIVEKIDTGGRNHLYRLAERFFNLWLIFTQGSPREKRRAKYLTIFLENFYDAGEVNRLAEEHLKEIEKGEIGPDKAALLTKAYSQSKYILSSVRDLLIEKTLMLPGIHEELKKHLPAKITDMFVQVQKLADKKAWKEAFSLIETIEQNDGVKDFFIGIVAGRKKDYATAERYLSDAGGKQVKGAFACIAWIYLVQGKLDLAETYALKALDDGDKSPQLGFTFCGIRYSQNRWKAYVIGLMKQLVQINPSWEFQSFLLIVKAWNGEFDELESDICDLIEHKNPYIAVTLIDLLIHHQKNLVNNLFHQKKFGEQLTEELLPVFYAVQVLLAKDPQISLKIPPELQTPVNELLAGIKEKQKFYYGSATD